MTNSSGSDSKKIVTYGESNDHSAIAAYLNDEAPGLVLLRRYTEADLRNRPKLQQVITDAKGKDFSILLSMSLGVVSSSLTQLYDLLQELEEVGVELRTINESFSSLSETGLLIKRDLPMFIDIESSQKSQIIRSGQMAAQKKGKRLGRPRISMKIEEKIRRELQQETRTMRGIANKFGVGLGTVQRIKADKA